MVFDDLVAEDGILRIAVASDLHAFDSSKISGASPSYLDIAVPLTDVYRHPIAALKKRILDDGVKADLLLCPGDMGNRADPVSIAYAWERVHEVGQALSAKLVAASSGNHDLDSRFISSGDAKGALLSLTPPYPLPDESTNDHYWARNFALVESDIFRLVILNSCAYHGGKQEEIEHGRVSESTLSALKGALSKSKCRPINVLLCHHHPQQHQELKLGHYDVMRNGQPLLDALGTGEYGHWLVIHGHKHHPKVTYASGGALSPIVFSAGSLSACLYPELATAVRNQFYVVEFNLSDIESFGLVGKIKSWEWAPSCGWDLSAQNKSGLSAVTGFGHRTNPALLANRIQKLVTSDKIDWRRIQQTIPEVEYLCPSDEKALRRSLKGYQLHLVCDEFGFPVEIGRAS